MDIKRLPASASAVLNRTQQEALAHYLLDESAEIGDDETAALHVENGQLVVNGLYLHTDGRLATYPEARRE